MPATALVFRTCRSLLSLLLLVGAGLRPATGQEPELARVELGEDRMIPGHEVTVPCYLRAADLQVGRIEMEVDFPHDLVSFQRVRPGLISTRIDARIEAAVEPSASDPERSVLRLSLAPGEEAPIPPGFLLDLVFRISPEVPADSPPIQLGNQPRVYRLGDPSGPVAGVGSRDGHIRAVSEAPPVASCFFYMH